MNINPVSYNGTNINDGVTYLSYIERAQAAGAPLADANYINRAGAWPLYSGKSFKATTYVLKIDCSPNTATTGYLAKFEDLNQLFSTEDETPHLFVVEDLDDANRKQYFIYAVPTGQPTFDNEGAIYTVKLALDDPIWQSSTDNTLTFSTTSSTDSTSLTVNGNMDSYPVFTVTPTSAPSTDYLYSMPIQFLPRTTKPWNGRAINLTSTTDGTTFDTAALIAAGKMQADGDDLRVFQGGVEVDRWINGINTTDTQVWVIANEPAAVGMSLKTALTAGAETTIIPNHTTANINAFSKVPSAGRLIIDSGFGTTDTEEFSYTAKLKTATKLSFTIGSRALRGTVAVAHGAGSSVRFLPYDFTIVYGNTSVSAPEVDDTRKPIWSLASSNVSLIYTNFYDVAQLRAGIWHPHVLEVSNSIRTNSGTFTSTEDAGDTDPASEMGITAEAFVGASGAWKADAIKIEWRNYFPELISSIATITGEQIQTVVGVPTFYLQSSTDGATWKNQFTVTAQVTTDYSTWTTWSKASTDTSFPANTAYLRFILKGTISGTADHYRKVGVDGITVNLTNNPHIMMRAEQTNVKLDITIFNETTGESFNAIAPMDVNGSLTIDTDPNFPTATYKGAVVNGSIRLDTTRAAWLRLQPGANVIGYECNLSSPFDVNIVITWKDRISYL